MQAVQPEGSAPKEAPAAPAPGPNIHWVGQPMYIHNDLAHYKAANVAGQQISLGDFVYLQPSDPTIPLYIGRIDDFLVSNNVPSATITWFYRPQELILDIPLPVFENEVFAADENETHPLDSVAGKCLVVAPGTPTQLPAGASGAGMDVYVCSRKYISTEGRVVPFADEQVGNDGRPFVLINGRILNQPAAGGFLKQQRAPVAEQQPTRQQPVSGGASKRRKREKTPTQRQPPSPRGNGGQFVAATTAAAAAPSGSVSHGGMATSDRSGGKSAGTGSGTPRGAPSSSPRNRKDHHGRWSTDRYEAAQRSLIHILRLMGATSPDVSVLRPTLREEARKVIGDTGLLDHLLKHLADQVVSPEGERLRRRHNREGHMEYWLQNPAAMEEEEKMMQNELTALTSELREVREARHALQTVRTEAAQAIQAVSGLKEHPTEAAVGLVGMQTPEELSDRIKAVELANVSLQRRLYDAESLAASGIEELRKELSQAGHVLGEHIGNFQKATEELTQRCRELEFKSAVATEDAAGRFEAVSAALSQAVGVTNAFRQEMSQRDVILGYLQREMAGVRQAVATVAMAGAPTAVISPQQAQQQQQPLPPVVTTTTSQTSNLSQPAQVAATAGSPGSNQQDKRQQQQQPFSAVPGLFAAPPATAKNASAADNEGTAAAAGGGVPGSSYQPLTPVSSGGGGDAATAPAAVTTSPAQPTDGVRDEEMPLQMSRQAIDPATMSLASQEDGNSPRLASTTGTKKEQPLPPS